ncbi:substrate-binding periplasmic protein [Pseudoduganella sp. OTU4001]|uniref:substrate-binding periplasmic protein n=1 Tax=Pseudoduganella sp. OTU4001 TaxID=3043854 RepID=UPI00313DC256
MRLKTNYWFPKVLLACLLACALAAPAHASKVVRVAFSNTLAPVSFVENGQVTGMLKEIIAALFSMVPEYQPEFHAYPWVRAQRMVEIGEMDMFVTFPSASRRSYAQFSPHPIYSREYGNLVFDRDNPNAARIAAARSFEDLKALVFVSQEAVAWEDENVPAYIKRYPVNGPPALMHMIFQRKQGDFFIMPEEQAVYFAHQFGYEHRLSMKKVGFIPNSLVAFHVGVRKSHPERQKLLAALDAAAQRPEFQARKRAIERKYQEYALAAGRAKTE